MKLLAEVNKAADDYVDTQINIAKNLETITDSDGLDIVQINETVTQFLTTYAEKAAQGKLSPQEKERAVNVFAALSSLTRPDTRAGHGFDDPNGPSLGQMLQDLYGPNGKEAHAAAEQKLYDIGAHETSSKAEADAALSDPNRVKQYAQAIRTKIEPVMNQMMARDRQQEVARQKQQQKSARDDSMGRPMQGVVPQRSGA